MKQRMKTVGICLFLVCLTIAAIQGAIWAYQSEQQRSSIHEKLLSDDPEIRKRQKEHQRQVSQVPRQMQHQPERQHCSHGSSNCVIVKSAIAAQTKEDFDLAWSMARADDYEALARLVLAGRVTVLEPGTEVTLLKDSSFTGRAQIRPRGYAVTLWTANHLIGPK